MKKRLQSALFTLILFIMPFFAYGQSIPMGTTSSFALFTASGAFTNTGASVVTGDIGSNIQSIVGIPGPGTLVGLSYSANATTAQATADVQTLYAYLATYADGPVHGAPIVTETLLPNVYKIGSAATLDGVLTLDGGGNPDAVFIFKIDGALSTSAGASVVLINSASLCNVYWQINGQFELGTNAVFRGNVVTNGAISLLEGAALYGRGLSQGGAITLQNNVVTMGGSVTAATITNAGATTFCAGNSIVLSGNTGGTWSNGETTESITVTTSGDYSVLTTTACGSAISNHIIVTVNPLATASVITAGGSLALCGGANVVLSGNVGGTWSTGATTATITVTAAGDYYVTNTSSCGDATSNHLTVTAGIMPVASTIATVGATTFCVGESIVLTGNVGGTWSNGAVTPSITVTASGDYTVANTNSCGTVTSNKITILVNPLPVASTITAGGSLALCAAESVVLSGNVGGTWSTGATTATITVTAAGDYSVVNTNSCGTVTSNHLFVTASTLPTASVISAGGAITICQGENVVLSGNTAGTWSNGAVTPSITVTASGDYTVANTNSCGTVTSNKITVLVNPLPVASTITAGGSLALCAAESVVLSGNVDGTWSTGATTATITVTSAGDYSVVNTNSCGTVTSNHLFVTASTLPTASVISAGGAITICQGENVVLSGNTAGTWSNGAVTPSITVTASGDYTVANTNSCGTVTSNKITVLVNPLPVASTITAGGSLALCAAESVVLSGNVDGTWSTGATTATITVTSAGDYSVVNTNSCGTVTSNHLFVTASTLPTASVITVSGTLALCAGENVVLSGNVGGTWSTNELTGSIIVTTAGDYFVTNTNDCGTVTSNHLVVTINPSAVASVIVADGATTFCEGEYVVLSGNVDGTWSTGATTATIKVTSAGEYSVKNVNSCGTEISNIIAVIVNEQPSVPLNQVTCAGSSVIFSTGVTIDGLTYQWRRGSSILVDDENISGSETATLTINSATTFDAGANYNVVITGPCSPYAASANVSLTVNSAPSILGQPYDQNACLNGCEESFMVVATGDGLSYQWRRGTVNLEDGGNISGSSLSRLTFSPVNITDTASNYNVVVTGYCGTEISEDVSLLICIPTEIKKMVVDNLNTIVTIYPNPFSNTLNISINEASKINSCELHIYNTLGEEIMVSTITKPSTTIETNNLTRGAYFYKVMSKTKTIQTGKLISVK